MRERSAPIAAALPSPTAALALLVVIACVPGTSDDAAGDGSATAPTTDASTSLGGSGSSGSSSDGPGMVEGSGSSGSMADSSGSDSGSSGGTTTGEPATWSIHTHSCSGPSRTDALLVEADAMWVGCGTNQVGYGLHGSFDGGASWSPIATDPANEAAQFRVSAIARGDDGLLYVAGFDATDSDMILGYDTSSSPAAVTQVLVAGNQVGTSFPAGSLGLLSGDRIFTESQTGYGALLRPDGSVGANALQWDDHYYWANGGNPPGYQMLDLVVHDDRMYACGSTIAEPPYLFLPAAAPAAEVWMFDAIELPNTGWTGEMWGVAATDERVVAVGVDQDGDVGKIYVSGADPYDAAGYAQFDLPDIVGGNDLGTWARGVCAAGDRIVVVGERQPLSSNTGLVMISEDGGASFEDITPFEDVTESVSKCTITPEGAVVVAGAGGFVGIYM
ncbi:MAG: hypothetical protein IPK74_37005 [Deltaproteobacteria bacterium]|nr:hypothetical protein [Deltaproteobacteria bacterium]